MQPIPVEFCKEHLLNHSGDAIRIICHGKTWSVRFSPNPRPRLGCGWKEFVKENHLDVGDVFVLELINHPACSR